MDSLVLEAEQWAWANFGDCALGDLRRSKRLVKFAAQIAAHPDGSTNDQTECWADCKAAYRLMAEKDVTPQAIVAPHCRLTKGKASGTCLIINDTTELAFPMCREVKGLSPVGNGGGQGFMLHTAMMVADQSEELAGIVGLELFHRQPRANKQESSAQRKRRARESQVWGRLIDQVGRPPEGARFIHVCDRGADNFEVFAHALALGTGWVIRASNLHRVIWTVAPEHPDQPGAGTRQSLAEFLARQAVVSRYSMPVRATKKQPERLATVEVRCGQIWMPRPTQCSPWVRQQAPKAIAMGVVELREVNAPKKVTEPLRWVLYTDEPIQNLDDALRAVKRYEKRPLIEEYHKALKTGCRVESRQYRTSERLERIAAVLAVVAVRLIQLKTVARVEPDRPAVEIVPSAWLTALVAYLRSTGKAASERMTVRDFFRRLAGLGGFLGRKGDGEPGWITIWRGLDKLLLIVRGASLAGRKCG